MKRPLVSLGDALRAAHELKPADTEAREAILQMLAMEERAATTPATPSLGASLPSSSERIATPPSAPPDPLRWRSEPETVDRSPAPATLAPSAFTLERIRGGTGDFALPAWLAAGEALASSTTATAPPPAPLPLFSRVQRRGILSAALGRYVDEGEIDVDRAIEELAAHRPLTTLPRLPAPTLRGGAQVLLDRGAGMDPFLSDQEALVRHLDDILSDDRLKVLFFVGCPSLGVSDRPRGKLNTWRAPPSTTVVLVVTDLGIGGPLLDEDRAGVSEWLRFAHRARAEGHALLGLVPYDARRWPPLLARAMVLLHWSERTTASEVRHAMRDSLHRRR